MADLTTAEILRLQGKGVINLSTADLQSLQENGFSGEDRIFRVTTPLQSHGFGESGHGLAEEPGRYIMTENC